MNETKKPITTLMLDVLKPLCEAGVTGDSPEGIAFLAEGREHFKLKQSDPWCALALWCANLNAIRADEVENRTLVDEKALMLPFLNPSVEYILRNTPKDILHEFKKGEPNIEPQVGDFMVWIDYVNGKRTTAGHIEIVAQAAELHPEDENNKGNLNWRVTTYGGNTSEPNDIYGSQRNGNHFAIKSRHVKPIPVENGLGLVAIIRVK